MTVLGTMIQSLCEQRGVSLTKLAKMSGVPKATLHSWTTGTNPNVEQLKKVAETLQISLHKLAFGKSDPFEEVGETVLKELFSGDVRVTVHRIERDLKNADYPAE